MQILHSKRLGTSRLLFVSFLALAPSVGSAQIFEIIDALGDEAGNPLDAPRSIAVDAFRNVYVPGLGIGTSQWQRSRS